MSDPAEDTITAPPDDSIDDTGGGDARWTWYSWQVILIILNALLGLIAFEWAWYTTKRHRDPPPGLEELMPAFRRVDAHKWRKWSFYPGALTLIFPRLIGGTLAGALALI